MIYKNVIVTTDCKHTTVLKYGDGDLLHTCFATASDFKPAAVLAIKETQLKLPINEPIYAPKAWSVKTFKPDVILMFSKVESIEVLIESLNKCKETLQKQLEDEKSSALDR